MNRTEKLKNTLHNNKKVAENYFFMTVLQLLNSFFYLLIYPYLIRTLGTESYGLYVFAYSIVIYFITLVSFGFDMPAVKAIAQNPTDKAAKEKVLSCVFTTKIYLEIVALLVFSAIIFSVPSLRSNWLIYCILFSQTLTNIIFPQWYFQGVQKMRIVTIIQFAYKLLSLPFIFLLVKTAADLWVFAIIITASSLLGGFTAMLMIRFKEKLRICWQPISAIRQWIKDAFPFFLSTGVAILKEQSVILIIGIFLNMREVAIYDLAYKIIALPRVLFTSINGAIFPKVIADVKEKTVQKIIRLEAFIGVLVIVAVVVFGKFAVRILGGAEMTESYPVAVILSVIVLLYLVVGAIHYFIFIPNNKYYYIAHNQIWAMISLLAFAVVGLIFVQSVYILAAAMVFSGVVELLYCYVMARKLKHYGLKIHRFKERMKFAKVSAKAD